MGFKTRPIQLDAVTSPRRHVGGVGS